MVKAMSARSTAPQIVAAVARDNTGPDAEHRILLRLSMMSGTTWHWGDSGCASVIQTFHKMSVVFLRVGSQVYTARRRMQIMSESC